MAMPPSSPSLLDPTRLNSPMHQFRQEIAAGFRALEERLVAIEAAAAARGAERAHSAAKGGDFEDLLEPMLGGAGARCRRPARPDRDGGRLGDQVEEGRLRPDRRRAGGAWLRPPIIGRAVKNTGDGAIAEFASVVDAVRCADEIQRSTAEQNIDVPRDKRIELRIGIHVGDIIIEENDIFGDGVNIAVRLEGIAEPGGISISDDARRQIRGKIDIAFEDLGPQSLKNIVEPMRVWRVPYGRAVPAVPNRRLLMTARAPRQTFHRHSAVQEHER